jgi:uncharacterized membrane protein YccC
VLFRVEPGRPTIGAGVRVAAAITVPLAIGLGTNHLTAGSGVSLGALNVAMADSGGPERTRAAVLSTATVVNAGVFALGIVAVQTLGLAVPLMFAVAFAAGLLTIYGRVASIVGFVTTVVYTLGLGFPPGLLTGPEALWLALVGGAWAMILALVLWPLRPYAPAQNAVGACYVAVGRMVAEICATGRSATTAGRASRSARDALEEAAATLRATRFGRDGESAAGRSLAALTESAGVLVDVSDGLAEDLADPGRLGSTATLVEEVGGHMGGTLRSVGSVVRAGGRPALKAAETAVGDLGDVVSTLRAEVSQGAGDATELAALRPVINSFRHLLHQAHEAAALAEDLHRGALGHGGRLLVEPAGAAVDGTRRGGYLDWWVALRSNLTLDSVAFRHALRYATVTAIGVLVFRSLSLPKGYWVALTIAVILKPFAGITLQRTLLRIGGTILGALLAVAITASVRSDWGTVLLMIPLAIVGFSLQPFNYGLWVIFFTPLVILTTEVAHPGQWTLAGWRIADTLIGAALALAGSYVLWPESSRGTARRELGAAVAANRAYFCAVMRRYVWPGPTTGGLDGLHRGAALAADNAEADLQRLLGERPGGGDLVELYWRLVGANRRVYGALTALESHLRTFTGRHRLPGLPELCHGLDAALSDLAGAIGDDRPPAPLPRLDASLAAVRDHLAEVELARAGERTDRTAGPEGRSGDTGRTSLVEELRDESVVAIEAERLVRGVTAMHSALAGG